MCRIAAHEEPAQIWIETAEFLVIEPLKPAARVHLLVLPRRHFGSMAELANAEPELAGALIAAADEAGRCADIADSGYRLIVNYGPATNQRIDHPHMHLIGGQPLGWTPA